MPQENQLEDVISRLSDKFDKDEDDVKTPEDENEPEDVLDDEPDLDEEGEGEDESSDSDDSDDSEEGSEDEGGPEEEVLEEADQAWTSLDEVLEAGSIDPSKLPASVIVAGQPKTVTLKEALNGYQRQADYDRNISEVKETKKALRAEYEGIQAQRTKLNESLVLADGYWNGELVALKNRRENIDWEKVRADDPGKYAAAIADFDREEKLIQAQQTEIRAKYDEIQKEAQEQTKKANADVAKEEGRRLLEAIPEWEGNANLFKEETEAMGQYLSQVGYQEAELARFVDHRALILARKAMLYDKAQAAAKEVVGDVKNPKSRKRPKRLLRPGSGAKAGARRNTKREAQLRKTAKETGSEAAAIQRLNLKFGN